jgi:hypothetical protein
VDEGWAIPTLIEFEGEREVWVYGRVSREMVENFKWGRLGLRWLSKSWTVLLVVGGREVKMGPARQRTVQKRKTRTMAHVLFAPRMSHEARCLASSEAYKQRVGITTRFCLRVHCPLPPFLWKPRTS